MDKKSVDQVIERETFVTVSDKIWEYAETSFQEFQSAELLCNVLQQEGFSVTTGIADIPTAFVGSFGSGKPVIGILGEYDALSGLSQIAGSTKKTPITEGGNGHGCGHNLLGAGALAAAVAVKEYIAEHHLQGTIRYYGCPGEEGGSGKTFMAREGTFDDVDTVLTWHPFTHNAIMSTDTLANFQVRYKFHGVSSHAAATPHLGRSALDAVELMNVGANYLREHIIQEARIHYAVTNTGGFSPNVVQAEAEVRYLIRAPKVNQVQEIYERVCDIARGAALMTGTKHEIIFDKACSNFIPNRTLEELLYKNFKEVGTPEPDKKEIEFAKALRSSLTAADIDNDVVMANHYMGGKGQDIIEKLKDKDIADVILPYTYLSTLLSGSTDVGDVSWIVPTAWFSVTCNAFGTPGHSWQTVSQGKSSLAHKGMQVAGKIMARTAIDVLLNPEIAKQAQAELTKILHGTTYHCPIPTEVKPLR